MYLLMPTTQNVHRIIKDFSDGRQQYLGAHLFFVDGTPFHLTSAPAATVEDGLVL
jgi:syntaxin-binding protein 1